MRIIVLSILLMFTGLKMYSQNANEYFEMAQQKIEQKNYQYAMVLIEKAINIDNQNQWYYLLKAEIQFKSHNPLEAIETVKECILINPKEPEPYNRAGSYYNQVNIPDSSILMYDLAIQNAKSDSSKYNFIMNRGVTKLTKRDFESALKDFETVLLYDPNNTGALNNIGPVYRQLGMIDKCITSLNKLLSLQPDDLGACINLGFVYSKIDSLNLAIEYFNKAIKINPNESITYNNRGYVYYKRGEYSNALNDINYSLKLYPDNSYAYRNLALVYIALNKMNEACTTLGYAKKYDFEKNYGGEVNELIEKYCEK